MIRVVNPESSTRKMILRFSILFIIMWIILSPAVKPAEASEPTSIPPVLTSTPRSDGSIIHIVQYGQALITIANAYGVTVDFIKGLNGLTSDEIFVGDKLIIRLAFTPTATGQESPIPTRSPRPTKTSTTTPTLRPITPTPARLLFTQTNTPTPANRVLSGITRDPILVAIILLVVSGGILMLAGVVLKRRG